VRAALLGLVSTLLPCGWLYTFAVLAAATGSAAGGAILMGAFWLGSLPMLLGVGVSVRGLARRWGARLPRIRSVAVMSAGAFTLLSRLQLPAFAEPARGASCHGHQLTLETSSNRAPNSAEVVP
jgi:sulfite exporter TauE/SafE